MDPNQEKILKEALSAAHRSKQFEGSGANLEQQVMRRIRKLAGEISDVDFGDLLQSMVWRFASAAAAVALVLAVYVTQTGFLPEYEVAEIFIHDNDIAFEIPAGGLGKQ